MTDYFPFILSSPQWLWLKKEETTHLRRGDQNSCWLLCQSIRCCSSVRFFEIKVTSLQLRFFPLFSRTNQSVWAYHCLWGHIPIRLEVLLCRDPVVASAGGNSWADAWSGSSGLRFHRRIPGRSGDNIRREGVLGFLHAGRHGRLTHAALSEPPVRARIKNLNKKKSKSSSLGLEIHFIRLKNKTCKSSSSSLAL